MSILDRPRAVEDAADLLVHYFRQIYRHVGLSWNSDNETEVRAIAYSIYDAAKD